MSIILKTRVLLQNLRALAQPSFSKPRASDVLNTALLAYNFPAYFSFYVPRFCVRNDQFFQSSFQLHCRRDLVLNTSVSLDQNMSLLRSINSTSENKCASLIQAHSYINTSPFVSYSIYRTGCFFLIKYYCIRNSHICLNNRIPRFENSLLNLLKAVSFGVPMFVYGLASFLLLVSERRLQMVPISIFFLYFPWRINNLRNTQSFEYCFVYNFFGLINVPIWNSSWFFVTDVRKLLSQLYEPGFIMNYCCCLLLICFRVRKTRSLVLIFIFVLWIYS